MCWQGVRAQFAGSVRRRDAEPDAALFPACPSKPANELEGLIRDKLPDPVRRHLIDVISTLLTPMGANWTAQPVWSHDVSNNDKGEFIRAMLEVLRGTMIC